MTHLDYDRQSPVWRHWVTRAEPRAHANSLRRARLRALGPAVRRHTDARHLRRRSGRRGGRRGTRALRSIRRLGRRADSDRVRRQKPRAREPSRPLRNLHARALQARRGEAEQSRLLIDLMRVGWGGTVPAFRQVFSSYLHPQRRRGAEALVRRHAAGLQQRGDGRTAVAVASGNSTSATRRAASPSRRSFSTRATTGRCRTRRGGASHPSCRTLAS